MTDPAEVVLVLHSVHDEIDEDVARAALPPDTIIRGCAVICPERVTLQATLDVDWFALANDQRRTWQQNVRPLLERYPAAGIAYFGLAPIPLAVHLGTLTERWPAIQVFQRRHDATRSWEYVGGAAPALVGPSGPNELSRSADAALVAISVTNEVDVEAARAAVGATSAEVLIRTETLGEDVLTSQAAVQAVGEAFRRALDLIERHRPGAPDVHLFAAVPCGLAFLLGTYVTSTRDPQVVTYQYHRGQETRMREALRVPERQVPNVSITAEQRTQAATSRAAWEVERQQVIAFLERVEAKPWWRVLGNQGAVFARDSMGALQPALETPLTSAIDVANGGTEGFRFDPKRSVWVLSDELVAAIAGRVEAAQLGCAGRMLLLHEALHHGRQGVNLETARQIRLAPKVLEELDYRADVWAMMHEFAYQQMVERPWSEQRSALIDIIDTAVSTMWAFDAQNEPGFLEVRRINRYLIWYTLLARLERAAAAADAFTIVAEKPAIELVGPPVCLRDNRFVAKLDGSSGLTYELVLLNQTGDLTRVGNTNAVSIRQLAVALGRHDGEAVLATLRGVL